MIPALVEVAKNIRNAVDDSEFSVYFNKAKNNYSVFNGLTQDTLVSGCVKMSHI